MLSPFLSIINNWGFTTIRIKQFFHHQEKRGDVSIPESFVNLERDRVFKSIKYISELAALMGSEKDITTLWLSGENLGAKSFQENLQQFLFHLF